MASLYPAGAVFVGFSWDWVYINQTLQVMLSFPGDKSKNT